MVAEKDAANVSLGKIADKYLERGHEVEVYAIHYEPGVLRYFSPQIARYPLDMLSDSVINNSDCIFASTVSVNGVIDSKLIAAQKPIYTHGYLIDGTIQWGGDICFLPSLGTTGAEYDADIPYSKIEIGEVKYDETMVTGGANNRLLFIDSGHYPFGEDGKRELARTLLKICYTYTDYELVIKPRFLPDDKIITHQNARHLYDVILEETSGNIPSNLNLLKEHRDLKQLINSAHTVICMFTSAYVGACAAGKGLVVLDNLPSEDVYDVRQKHFDYTRKHLKLSGALVDYKNVNEILPHGVKCSKEYLDYLLAERVDVASKICEITEYLDCYYFSKGKFPQELKSSYNSFFECVNYDEDMTWERYISNRFVSTLAYKSLIMISFSINAKLDIYTIRNELKRIRSQGLMSVEEFFKELRYAQTTYREECIVANKDRMLEDDIDSGILLNALYRLKRIDEIKSFPITETGAYHLFRGFVAYDENDIDRAVLELKEYMRISLGRPFIKEISDMSNNKLRAFSILIDELLKSNSDESKYYLEEMKKYYNVVYLSKKQVVDRIQAQQYAYVKWFENKINGYNVPNYYPNNEDIIVYGAGVLAKKLLLCETELKKNIVAFVDAYSKREELDGIPIIRLEKILDYPKVHTVIVTVLQEYERIREKIISIREDIKVIPIVEREREE